MRRRWASVAAGVLALSAAATGPAGADEKPAVPAVTVAEDGTTRQSVDIDRLYPTATRQVVFFLEGENLRATRIRLAADDLVDHENECIRPEKHSNDRSCGDDGGELSGFVVLDLTPGRETAGSGPRSCQPVTEGRTTTTVRRLADEPVTVSLPAAGARMCAVATFTHADRDGDNVTQTDSSSFDLTVSVDSKPVTTPAAAAGVLGTYFDAPVTPSAVEQGELLIGLPRTGLNPAVLLSGGALLAVGAGVLLVTARREGSRTEACAV